MQSIQSDVAIASYSTKNLIITILICYKIIIIMDISDCVENLLSQIKYGYSMAIWPNSHHKHVILLLVIIPCFLFLWMPYTFLFLMQWQRKVDHYKPLKPLVQYKPINIRCIFWASKRQVSQLVWITAPSTRNTSCCVIPHFKPSPYFQFASIADYCYPFALLPQSYQDI